MGEPTPIEGYEFIEWNPDVVGGSPVLKGTKVSISVMLAHLAESTNPDDIFQRFPELTKEAIPEVLRYASEQLFRLRKNKNSHST